MGKNKSFCGVGSKLNGSGDVKSVNLFWPTSSTGLIPIFLIKKGGLSRLINLLNETVCNFRLLGDDKNSTIHFADITDEFYDTILDTRQKFYDKWIEADSGFFISAVNDENFPTFQSYGDSDQIINVDAWHNHMTVKEIKNGFESPFMLNLGNVHRVFVGDQSTRVTFRLHSSKKLDWKTIKQYRDTGVLLKWRVRQ